jgi:hypothetical protein
MKKQASPAVVIFAIVLALALMSGLYYRFLGAGSNTKSAIASPYGLPTGPDAFKTPLPTKSSGRNAITGEALDAKTHDSGPIGSLAPPPAKH